MRRTRPNERVPFLLTFLGCALLLLTSSCATTTLEATWHDKSYDGKHVMDDVLIIALTKDETMRRLYEDTFVEKLSADGLKAIASYTLLKSDIKPTKEAVEAAVMEAGATSVLITRYIGSDTKENYVPPQVSYAYRDPFYRGMYGYYPLAYREVYSPGYTVSVTTVSLESNLYDAKNGTLVWATRSESVNPKMTKQFVNELVDLFTQDLKKSGLL